jgi:hypothetical protein
MLTANLTTLDAGVVSLTVALIAGGFGLLTLHINKRNRIAEFRQAWIDAFRQELGAALSLGRTIASNLDYFQDADEHISKLRKRILDLSGEPVNKNSALASLQTNLAEEIATRTKMEDAHDTVLREYRLAHYKVLLRLNFHVPNVRPGESRHTRVKRLLTEFLRGSYLTDGTSFSFSDASNLLDGVLEVSSLILKDEWDRVKQGEIIYRTTRAIRRARSNLVRSRGKNASAPKANSMKKQT